MRLIFWLVPVSILSGMDEKNTKNLPGLWFLRSEDQAVYGPVDIPTLQTWCQDGRIEPENEVSRDQENWVPAHSIPALEMDWYACLDDGEQAGPFHAKLLPGLIKSGAIPPSAQLEHRNGESMPADSFLHPRSSEQPEPLPTKDDDSYNADHMNDLNPNAYNEMESAAEEESVTPLQQPHQELPQLQSEHTLLKDECLRLKEELETARESSRQNEERLLEQQERCATAEIEADNLKAQLEQINEHYERLQQENQNQFEQLDALRADLLSKEQRFKNEQAQWQQQNRIKTERLARTVQSLMQDQDVARVFGEESAAAEANSQECERLKSALQRLEADLEQERKSTLILQEKLTSVRRIPSATLTAIILPGGVIVLLLVLLLLAGFSCFRRSASPVSEVNTLSIPETNRATEKPQISLSGSMDLTPDLSLTPELAATPPAAAMQNHVDWPVLSLPRADISKDTRSLRIVFQYGLFSSATRLTPEAEEDLRALALQLPESLNGVQLLIEGHTDATPMPAGASRYVDNFALGMARAEAVKKFLATSEGIPLEVMSTSSAGDATPPFSNETEAGRLRNRTAILTLVRR